MLLNNQEISVMKTTKKKHKHEKERNDRGGRQLVRA